MDLDIEGFKTKFEEMIIQKMTDSKTPGFAITIKHEDTVVYQRGFGARDLSQVLPYDTDTLNGFGSNTKSMTALAILMLEDEEKLSIDDPIAKYLPVNIGIKDHPILIRHLMSHSSGIPNLGMAELNISQMEPSLPFPKVPLISWDDLFNHVNAAQEELLYKPGEHFFYCNSGFTLLGEIVTRVSGKPYEEFIKERILTPLSMIRSAFKAEDLKNESNISVPYFSTPSDDETNNPRVGIFPFNQFIYAPGGLLSSTNEMMNYISMMMNNGEYNGKQMFKRDLINRVTTPQIESSQFSNGSSTKYAFGWLIVDNFQDDTLVIHGGGITGGLSQMAYLKDHKIAITAISNYAINPTEVVLMAFCYLLSKDPDMIFPYLKKTKHLSKFVGNYQTYKAINKRKIILESGMLMLANEDNDMKFPLLPKSDSIEECHFEIQMPDSRIDVDFIENENGIHLTVERNLYHKI